MDSTRLNWIANFIWGIADDVGNVERTRMPFPFAMTSTRESAREPSNLISGLALAYTCDAGARVGYGAKRLQESCCLPFLKRRLDVSGRVLRILQPCDKAWRSGDASGCACFACSSFPVSQDILENFQFRNQIPRLSPDGRAWKRSVAAIKIPGLMKEPTKPFALCVDNTDCKASLIPGKVYRIIPHSKALKDDPRSYRR
jgi:hypothetical protein